MLKKPLIETNTFLRDPSHYRRDLITNVSSSTAVETGARVASVAKTLSAEPLPNPVKRPRAGSR